MNDRNCDFCAVPEPLWVYPAAEFETHLEVSCVGDWYACQACHTLIDSADWDRLISRSTDLYLRAYPESAGNATAAYHGFVALYRQFQRRRTGSPYALAERAAHPCKEPRDARAPRPDRKAPQELGKTGAAPARGNQYVILLRRRANSENRWVVECDGFDHPISGKSVYSLVGQALRSILALDTWELRKQELRKRAEARLNIGHL
jgi:hypothetical protein